MTGFQFFNVIGIVVGLGIAAFGVALFLSERRARSWPKVTGTMTQCDFVERFSGSDSYQEPYFAFEYHVDGRAYRSHRVPLGLRNRIINGMAGGRALDKYAVGRKVLVYYDPEDPAGGELERPSGASWIALVVGAMFIGINGLLLFHRF